ncbi:MAG: DUF3883 domain-containing protein [Nocardiaceae bacterium]|nr:DUF3883 domain-containing protein [Nocardiaceae bacterium]
MVDVRNRSGEVVRTKVKARTIKDWQARKNHARKSVESGVAAWAFVDLGAGQADFWIVPAEQMVRVTDARVGRWMASDPSRDPETQTHFAVRPVDVQEWKDRWDVLRLANETDSAPRVTPERLGAWVLKCNPMIWNIGEFVAEGNDVIESWSVADNYRTDMLEHGQRVLLWVAGGSKKIQRGFWGSGWIVGPATPAVEGDDDGYWLDPDAQAKVALYVPTEITLFDEPVPANEVSSVPGLRSMEVFRAPQTSNPSWLTIEELGLLEPLLPEWPEEGDEHGTTIAVGFGGAGFGDPLTNRVVEQAAVKHVTQHFNSLGYEVEDVGQEHLGWDLTCTARGRETVRVEVKGVSGRRQIVLLTKNEVRSAREDQNWQLAIVTRAQTSPELHVYDANSALKFAEPFLFKATMPS